MTRIRTLYFFALAAAALGFAIAGWDVAFGGFHLEILGLRISSWETYKPLRVGEICACLAFLLHDWPAPAEGTSWSALDRWAPRIVAAVALLFLGAAINYGIYSAGAADGYGYVSQASLWTSGHILTSDPLADLQPVLGDAVAPLGYRLALVPGFLAPIYSPGLPITMALARVVTGGVRPMYMVIPILGAVAVWLTYVLTSRVADRRTGCIAAILLAFSPLWLFHSLVPMSDVPVTAWWLLAWVLALSPAPFAALGAGVASAAAILTRPNIVPLAAVLALFITVRSGFRRGLAYACGVVPAALVIATWNKYLYGSPIGTGYGPLDYLFNARYLSLNLINFWTWLIDLHTPAVLIGLWALFTGRVRHTWWLVAFSVVLLGCYVFYLPFDNWTFLRFLMPAMPILALFCASSVVALVERLPLALRGAVTFAVCALAVIWLVTKSDSLRMFEIAAGERRYVTVGEAMGRLVPADAVLLSMIHSGSVRLYGDRVSARWDLIDPKRFDATIATIREHGRKPYFLLEDWEETRVRARFADVSALGKLDWPPTAEYVGHAQVRLYSIDDRDRYLRGEPVLTTMIPAE